MAGRRLGRQADRTSTAMGRAHACDSGERQRRRARKRRDKRRGSARRVMVGGACHVESRLGGRSRALCGGVALWRVMAAETARSTGSCQTRRQMCATRMKRCCRLVCIIPSNHITSPLRAEFVFPDNINTAFPPSPLSRVCAIRSPLLVPDLATRNSRSPPASLRAAAAKAAMAPHRPHLVCTASPRRAAAPCGRCASL